MNKRVKNSQLQVYVKPGLSLQEVQQAKTYFDQLKDKETGLINAVQIRQILESYGQKAGQNQLHYTFQAVLDTYGQESMGCKIDFQQFLYLITSNVSDKDSKVQMKRLFSLYDDNRNGYLNKQKLRNIADEYGIWITDEELQLMIKTANITGDGEVTEEQFYMIMTGQK